MAEKAREPIGRFVKRPYLHYVSNSIKIDIVAGEIAMEKGRGIKFWAKKAQLEKIKEWAEDGLSAKQIAENMGISRSTLYEWVQKNTDIADSFTCGRACAVANVENQLYQKTQGYNVGVKKVIKLKKAEYKDGKIVKAWEEPMEITEEIHVPADTAAIKFYLTNMNPEKWKNNADNGGSGEENTSGVVMLPEANKAVPPEEEGGAAEIETTAEEVR